MKKYFGAFPDFWKLNKAVFKQNKLLFFALLAVFVVFDYRVLNIDLVDAYDVDEFYFLKMLYSRQYYGFNHLDFQKFFSGFYSYGRAFWVAEFVVTYIPFALGKYSTALFVARFLSSLFAAQGLLLFKETLTKLGHDRFAVIIISGVSILMIYLWAVGSWLHPDWMMMYFVMLAFYYFFDTEGSEERRSINFLMAFAIAVAVKVQSIQLMPLLLLYNCKPFFVQPSIKAFGASVKSVTVSLLVIVIVFVALNPYLLHPKGLPLFLESFTKDMASNKTNHFSAHIPTAAEKIASFSQAYVSKWIMALAVITSLTFAVINIKRFKVNFEKYAFLVTLFVVIAYYLLAVNKTWPHYYLPIAFMALIALYFTHQSVIYNAKVRQVVLTLVLVVQIVNLVVHFDFLKDWLFPERSLAANNAYELKDSITKFFNKQPDAKNAVVLFTYKVPVPVRSAGLNFKNVFHAPVIDENQLKQVTKLEPEPPDYLVVQKNFYYTNDNKSLSPEYDGTVALLDSIRSGKHSTFKLVGSDKHFFYIKREPATASIDK